MSFRPLRVTRIQHRRREYGAGKRAERGVERRDNDKRVVEGVLVGNYIDTGYLAKGATTRFAADFQFLDTRGQQRIFGARGTFVQGLYINGSAASGGKLAWNFMGTEGWVAMGASPGRLRRIATFDRVGKTIAVTNYDDRAQFYYNNDHADLLKDTDDANTIAPAMNYCGSAA